MLAEMTASEDLPAGISCDVTFSVGWAVFQASTTCLPQATSCSLFESQTVMGPCAVAASVPEDSSSPPQAARARTKDNAATPASGIRGFIVFSFEGGRAPSRPRQVPGPGTAVRS